MRPLLALFVLTAILSAQSRRVDIGYPQLEERLQVVFPDNYDESKKWPAVFYYHGTGGKPTTELIRAHTGGKDWFVVGMTYRQGGNLPATAEYVDQEREILDATRKYLTTKYNLDPKRVYVAGFSKGGWMSGFLLQRDPSLAGAIILGAGHNFLIQKPRKFPPGKPLFVGIGRHDPNYPFSLRALVHFRPLGVQTTLDTWNDIGHQMPPEGSQALRQWLALEARPAGDHKPAAKKWLSSRLDEIKTLPNLVDQWVALRDLETTPYLRLLGEPWKTDLEKRIATLEMGGRVAAEAKALAAHRDLLRQEMKGHTLELCHKLALAYLKLSETHAGTRQATIALVDHERLNRLILHIREQDKIAQEKKETEFNPFPSDEPENNPFPKPPTKAPLIPRNPLIR